MSEPSLRAPTGIMAGDHREPEHAPPKTSTSQAAWLFPSGPYGFRFSPRDLIAILVALALTAAGRPWIGSMAALPIVVLGHFFLFCNVFRVRRSYELAWSAAFLLNFSAVVVYGAGDWLTILAVQTPITASLIALERGSDRYHGIGAVQSESASSERGSSG